MCENSLAIHCWVRQPQTIASPVGTIEASAVPTRLGGSLDYKPSNELLGYFHWSLRDRWHASTTMKLAIHGAAGRMGQRVTALAVKDSRFQVVAALESADHPLLGKDAGLIAGVGEIGVPLGVVGESNADVVIDFSVPDAAVAVIAHCVGASRPVVVATTGLDSEQQAFLTKAAHKIPIVWSPSMSTAVNVAMKLTDVAARALKDLPTGVDVEIVECHHRFKEDSPSGTALKFGKIAAKARITPNTRHGRPVRLGL